MLAESECVNPKVFDWNIHCMWLIVLLLSLMNIGDMLAKSACVCESESIESGDFSGVVSGRSL